jgi:hypothetical protein
MNRMQGGSNSFVTSYSRSIGAGLGMTRLRDVIDYVVFW